MSNIFERARVLMTPDPILISSVSAKLRQLEEDLNFLYPEREAQIRQLIMGLVTRYHVLQWGPPGTGKTAIAKTLFAAITGANVWDRTVSAAMPISEIFGVPNMAMLRDQSIVVRETKGTILEANFALVDEWGDLDMYVKRGDFLRFMNEREYSSGGRTIPVPLHMLVATTNWSPVDLIAEDKQNLAAIERFVMRCSVHQMRNPDNEYKMVDHYLSGRTTTTRISLEELTKFSDLVVKYRLLNNPLVLSTYVKVVNAYEDLRKKKGGVVSNREMNYLTQIVEGQALLYGRAEVDLDDVFNGLRIGLCDAGDPHDMAAYAQVAAPIVEEARKLLKQPIDDVQLKLITEYAGRVVRVKGKLTDDELVKTLRRMVDLKKSTLEIKPETERVDRAKKDLLLQIESSVAQLNDRIQGGG